MQADLAVGSSRGTLADRTAMRSSVILFVVPCHPAERTLSSARSLLTCFHLATCSLIISLSLDQVASLSGEAQCPVLHQGDWIDICSDLRRRAE